MKVREKFGMGLEVVLGGCCAFLTLRGVYGLYALDLRSDTLVSSLYCFFPFTSFFIFLWIKAPKLKALLLAAVAIGYLAAYSVLNWRTCDSVGYCTSVAATIWETFCTKSILAAFSAVILTVVALLIDGQSFPRKKAS
jgi:uncharacterized membrane protein